MDKLGFISELVKKTGISTEDGEKVNEIFESNPPIGDLGGIIAQVAAKLGIGEEQAKGIVEKAKEIIGSAILDKLKNPFGNQ